MCDMPVSCMICLKAIQGLGGGPICFLLLLIHTLNILFYEFDSNASINFLTFKCHTQKNGTDLRRSPLVEMRGDVTDAGRTTSERRTTEHRATQPMEAGG